MITILPYLKQLLILHTLQINIVVLLFPVLRAIAVHTLSTTIMQISASNITHATNTDFTLTLEGQAHKVGVFPAHLYFINPVDVYWIAPENLSLVSCFFLFFLWFIRLQMKLFIGTTLR